MDSAASNTKYMVVPGLCTSTMSSATIIASKYIGAASVSCFLWDYLLTLNEEIELIWKRGRWGVGHVCYAWNRYATIVGLIHGAFNAEHPL
ncbi:hypothetical protein EIP86_007256 [Pleurotus ostreatoroseus]|nr:hypothetical protein EIP86_007256 [Pleurotus ostreatoroseus]